MKFSRFKSQTRSLSSESDTLEPDDLAQSNDSLSTIHLEVGSVFAEKYKILEHISSGANGQVFKTVDLHRSIEVALKVISIASDDTQIMRFQSEAKLASKLRHKNIATINDFGLENQLAYLAMEYVNGQTLDVFFGNYDTFDLDLFISVFEQIADAISHAHKRGVIHRDLKPGNIMVCEQPDHSLTVKVLDFGLAKRIDHCDPSDGSLTAPGSIIGTPLFMSPEQAQSIPATPQSDIYSLGAVMFYCITGEAPLEGNTAIETIMLVANSEVPSIQQSFEDGELPDELVKLIDSMLAKKPENRPDMDSRIIPALQNLREDDSEDNADTTFSTTSGFKFNKVAVIAALGALSTCFIMALWMINWTPSEHMNTSKQPGNDGNNSSKKIEPNRFRFTDEDLVGPRIIVSYTTFNDSLFAAIKKPEEVEEFGATNTNLITLDGINRLKNLKILDLTRTEITDDAIPNLEGLPLKNLVLNHDNITDRSLTSLSKIKTLEWLQLTGTKVTPAGLKHLRRLRKLNYLDLRSLNYSNKDIETFALSIPPNCFIDLGFDKNVDQLKLKLLEAKYPDLSFSHNKTAFLHRVAEANQKLKKKANSLEDWRKLRLDYLALLAEAEKAYGKKSNRLYYYHAYLGNMEGELKMPPESRIRHYLAALTCAEKLEDKTQALRMVRALLKVSTKVADSKVARTVRDEAITVAKEMGLTDFEITD